MNTRLKINTHLDAVIHSMKKMDIEMVSTLLNDTYTYQDYSKSLFIRKLGDLFFEFQQLGDFHLNTEKGECLGCSCGINGFTFIGNKSKSYIDIVFVTNDDAYINDIYECGEFFNNKSGLRKKNRLYIEKDVNFELVDDDYWEGDDQSYGDDDLPF